MGRYGRTETITHDIGAAGRLSVRTVSGDVRVRTVGGTVAKVVARYDVRTPAGSVGEIPPDASPLVVRKGAGELEIDTRDRVGGFLDTLGEVMSGGSRTTVEYDVELPHEAALRVHGVSGDLTIDGARGSQEYHTVSGDISIRDVTGRINVHAVSGDVSIADGHDLEVDGNSTSGDVHVRAERLTRFGFSSVSGDISVEGQLAPGEDYRVQTVTGDLELITPSGVEVEASGPSVSLRTKMPHRSDSGRGRKVITVGDGAARVRFRSMSGDVTVSTPDGRQRPRAGRGTNAQDAWQAAEAASRVAESVGRVAERAGRRAEAFARRIEGVGQRVQATVGPAFTDLPAEDPDGSPSEPPPADRPEEPMDQMAVLRALERGEIDVAEATRLLSEAAPRG